MPDNKKQKSKSDREVHIQGHHQDNVKQLGGKFQ